MFTPVRQLKKACHYGYLSLHDQDANNFVDCTCFTIPIVVYYIYKCHYVTLVAALSYILVLYIDDFQFECLFVCVSPWLSPHCVCTLALFHFMVFRYNFFVDQQPVRDNQCTIFVHHKDQRGGRPNIREYQSMFCCEYLLNTDLHARISVVCCLLFVYLCRKYMLPVLVYVF